MKQVFQLSETEVDIIRSNTEKIEMLIDEIFNRGMPKTYEDYLSEKLNEIEKLNDEMNGVICH